MEGMAMEPARLGYRRRSLRDSWLEVAVDLDRAAPVDVITDSDALSEALAALAGGGGFALRLRCEGGHCADLRLVVEDCALELGAALRDALGSAATASRAGPVPRLEGPGASVGIDLAGPPGAVCTGFCAAERDDALPPALISVFFDSLARALGAHIDVEARSRVPREAIRAAFAGVGRALRAAGDPEWTARRAALSRR